MSPCMPKPTAALAAIQMQAPRGGDYTNRGSDVPNVGGAIDRTFPIRFSVPGKPIAWSRTSLNHGTRQIFKPKPLAGYQSLVAWSAIEAMAGHPPFAAGVPLSVAIKAVFAVPVSWSKRKRAEALAGGSHTGRPDADNLAKCIGDAGNGVLWHDDSSIARLLVVKCYGPVAELVVEVEPLTMNGGS